MLEIFFVRWLCGVNKRNALMRGKKPGGYIALTVILWFGLELVGAFIGASSGGEGSAYLFALMSAGIGGFVSYLAAKSGVPVDEVSNAGDIAGSKTPSQLN